MTPSAPAAAETEAKADTSSLPDGTSTSETTPEKAAETTAAEPDERAEADKPADEGKPEPDYSKLAYPDDLPVDDSYRDEITKLGKDLGLAPDKVQALIDRDVARIKYEQGQATDQRQQWADAAKATPDYAEQQKNIDAALAAVPEFHAAAKDAGLLDHPAVRKLTAALGAALAEPSALAKGGKPSAVLSPREQAQRDFPESPSEWPEE